LGGVPRAVARKKAKQRQARAQGVTKKQPRAKPFRRLRKRDTGHRINPTKKQARVYLFRRSLRDTTGVKGFGIVGETIVHLGKIVPGQPPITATEGRNEAGIRKLTTRYSLNWTALRASGVWLYEHPLDDIHKIAEHELAGKPINTKIMVDSYLFVKTPEGIRMAGSYTEPKTVKIF
jgi:hypothetical protein